MPGAAVVGELDAGVCFAGGSSRFGVVHFNIRSIYRNFEELLIYLEKMDIEQIHVIILSETFNINELDRFNIRGYSLFHNNSVYNKNDGLLIYIRNDLNAETKIFELTETNISRLKITFNQYKMGITSIYRPPSTNLNLFLTELEEYFANLKQEQIDLLIGDLNINILDEKDKVSNVYMNLLTSYGYENYLNQPTRVT